MGDNRNHGWTEERIAALKAMWLEQRLTAGQIAARLGGVTRNAVLGKVHRLGLGGLFLPEEVRERRIAGRAAYLAEALAARPRTPARPRKIPKEDRPVPEVAVRPLAPALAAGAAASPKPKPKPASAKPAPAPAPAPVPAAAARPVEPEPLNLPLEALKTGRCKWPFGNGPYVFCGCPTTDPTEPLVVYCAFHARKAYQAARPVPKTPPRPFHRRFTPGRAELYRQAAGRR